jgi:hypothetical protein
MSAGGVTFGQVISMARRALGLNPGSCSRRKPTIFSFKNLLHFILAPFNRWGLRHGVDEKQAVRSRTI